MGMGIWKVLPDSISTIPRERKIEKTPSIHDLEDPLKAAIMERLRGGRPPAVRDLIAELGSLGNKRSEVASKLRELEDEGVVELRETSGQLTLARYVVSPQSVWFLASLWMLAATFFTLLIPSGLPSIFSIPLLYARYVLGGLLVLYLPGYALMSVIYPHRFKFDEISRFAISISASLAIGVLLGFALAVSPVGLTTGSTTVSLGIFTLVFLLVGLKRKYDYRYVNQEI
jgi:DNA-binding transcriptional ArsR family regulator